MITSVCRSVVGFPYKKKKIHKTKINIVKVIKILFWLILQVDLDLVENNCHSYQNIYVSVTISIEHIRLVL